MIRAYLSSGVLYSAGRLVVRSPQSLGDRFGLLGRAAWVDEDADHHGNLAAIDQVIHHVLRADVALLVFERLAVVEDHQAGRLGLVVLRGHVDPVSVLRPGIDLARQRERADDLAAWHAFLLQRIGTELVEVVESLRELRKSRRTTAPMRLQLHESWLITPSAERLI